ncbi:MDGA2 protein, partial [Pachycephala philippinensis]|nr:MDGA2 protein [Pachycephala philippinensis]
MYIETSRPRLEGEKARLVSPVFSVAPKNPYGATNTAYCFSFYYHMYGQHIGERKPMSCSFPLGKIPGKTSSCLEKKRGRSGSPSKELL